MLEILLRQCIFWIVIESNPFPANHLAFLQCCWGPILWTHLHEYFSLSGTWWTVFYSLTKVHGKPFSILSWKLATIAQRQEHKSNEWLKKIHKSKLVTAKYFPPVSIRCESIYNASAQSMSVQFYHQTAGGPWANLCSAHHWSLNQYQ